MKKRVSVCLVSASISLTPNTPAIGAQNNNPHATSMIPTAAHNDLGIPNGQVEELLYIVDSIPDEVLAEGDEATAEWVWEKYPNTTVVPYWATEAACAGAIAWAIGSTLIPAAKILKIKRYIQRLGGLKAAVSQLRAHNFSWPSIQRTGGALRDLGAEIIGVAGVAEYCFNS